MSAAESLAVQNRWSAPTPPPTSQGMPVTLLETPAVPNPALPQTPEGIGQIPTQELEPRP